MLDSNYVHFRIICSLLYSISSIHLWLTPFNSVRITPSKIHQYIKRAYKSKMTKSLFTLAIFAAIEGAIEGVIEGAIFSIERM